LPQIVSIIKTLNSIKFKRFHLKICWSRTRSILLRFPPPQIRSVGRRTEQ